MYFIFRLIIAKIDKKYNKYYQAAGHGQNEMLKKNSYFSNYSS